MEPELTQLRTAFSFWHMFFLPLLVGCSPARPPIADEPPRSADLTGSHFNPATAGSIRGQVVWQGEVPQGRPFEVPRNPLAGKVFHEKRSWPNPNAPVVDGRTGGVASAVVFLRGVEAQKGRPWDHASVRVEQRDCQFHIVQGLADSPFGFVRRSESIEMVSHDRHFHSLHAGGAAFFSLTFPDPDQPLKRRLQEKGIVELTSAAGYYWMRAYLFVDEHPYYTRTDSEGRFVLSQVPPGQYEVVCWIPNWREACHERDPESGIVYRLSLERPVEHRQKVTLDSRQTLEVSHVVSAEAFQADKR
jgi:hypothetical protein